LHGSLRVIKLQPRFKVLIIHTNIKDADISTDFEEKVALKVSETINYPLEVNSLHKLFVSLRMSNLENR
jgi:hypothetical protein